MKRILPSYHFSFVNKLARRLLLATREQHYFRHFFSGITYPEPTKGNVLLYAGIGYMYLTPLELLFYHLLRKEGYSVDYYIYDKFIPAHELITEQVMRNRGKQHFLTSNTRRAERILTSAGVNYSFIQMDSKIVELLRPISTSLEEMLNFTFDGVHFGNIVRGAMYRYYRSLSFREGAVTCAYNYLHTSLINYFEVKRLNEENRYKYVLFSHGINCTWEPVVEYCKHHNIKFVCYDRAKRLGSANFNVNQPSPVWNFDSAWERYLKRALTSDEERWVDDQLNKRELHTGDVYAYNLRSRAGDLKELREQLNIREGTKVLTIFTNLIWDAANVSRDIAFASPLDCIEQVIKRYGNDSRIHVLLRPHPAERILGTDETYSSLVYKLFDNKLPPNFSVVDPLEVNSFSVIEITDMGVVNTSTVGLELAMLGKPVILISDTHYRGKGFTLDAYSAEDFFSKVDQWLERSGVQVPTVLARKYFFMMMNLYQKDTPLIIREKVFDGYRYEHFSDMPESDDVVRVIKSLGDSNLDDFVWWSNN